MIILGIDPGSRKTGFGLIKKEGNRHTHIENGTLYLEKQEKYTDRLVSLYKEIQSLIEAFSPEALAIENIFYYKNAKSTQKLGEVRGVAMLSASISGIKVFEYTPLEVKKAVTGYGKAPKIQMQNMTRTLLNLKDIPEENAGDALAVALCHAQSCNLLSQIKIKETATPTKRKILLKNSSFYR